MNIGQLEGFVVLSEELHFGRAAKRLSVGTPNLSKRITDLEHEFGVRLFERTSRHVTLTPAGELLLDGARRSLADLRHLQTMASNAAHGLAGVVRIAYSPGTGQTTAALVRRLRDSELRLDVTIEQVLSVQVMEAVRSGRATMGICRRGSRRGLNRLVLSRSVRNLVAMPEGHRLARLRTIAPSDLDGETFIHPDSTVASWAGAPEILSLPGVHIDVKFEHVVNETEVLDRVAAGFGLSLISGPFYERNRRPDVVAVPISDLPVDPVEEIHLIWRADDDSRLAALVVGMARALPSDLPVDTIEWP